MNDSKLKAEIVLAVLISICFLLIGIVIGYALKHDQIANERPDSLESINEQIQTQNTADKICDTMQNVKDIPIDWKVEDQSFST